MKGQPNYKTTPDQAWANMKAILDEAMPVQPRRRFPVWVWWSTSTLGILLLTGFSYMAMSGQHDDTRMEISPAAITPALHNTPSVPATLNASESKASPGHDQQIQHVNPVDQNLSPENTQIKTSSQSPKNNSQAKQSNRNTSAQKQTIPMAEATTSPEQLVPLGLQNNEQNEVVTADAFQVSSTEEMIFAERNQWITDPIETNVAEQDIVATDLFPGIGNIKPGRRQNHNTSVSPYLMANGLAGFNAGTGYSLGAGVDLNLNRRFAATVSTGYFSYATDSRLIGGSVSLDASPGELNPIIYYPTQGSEDEYVNESLVNTGTSYREVKSLVSNLSQWQINAGIKYRISPRFFTEAGFQVGLFTKAYSDYTFASIDPLSNAVADVRSNVVLNDYDIVQSTTTALFGSIGYRIGKHLDLFGGITYGLDHYLVNEGESTTSDQQSPDRADYIRGVNLGLRYHL